MIIPWQRLESQVLNTLLEEVATRDGTDYGVEEMSTAEKVEELRMQLRTGRVLLVWDEESETGNIVDAQNVVGSGSDFNSDSDSDSDSDSETSAESSTEITMQQNTNSGDSFSEYN